eukprot:TRINITY_DN65325_c0_g1_i1.p1 TRINITY_DN65325_c0_g1~~TRINITY_DN65325_c0_g1_i1.p1  ORF type:complete len:230 (-),score=21.83 TRINITY_DN65325_c0_g1_i1:98-787(-)
MDDMSTSADSAPFQRGCEIHPIRWKLTHRYLKEHGEERQDILYKTSEGTVHLLFKKGRPQINGCRRINRDITRHAGIDRVLYVAELYGEEVEITFGALTQQEDYLEDFLGELIQGDVGFTEASTNYIGSNFWTYAHMFLTRFVLEAPRSAIRQYINAWIAELAATYSSFPYTWFCSVVVSDLCFSGPLLNWLRNRITNALWESFVKSSQRPRAARPASTVNGTPGLHED